MNKGGTAIPVIREILGWGSHDDDTKYYFIKSYLLGWTDEQYIHDMTERDSKWGISL